MVCLRRYRTLPVETVTDDAGDLDPQLDIGEYVQFQLAKERKRVTPPWFFPTHLLPQPRHIPKGTRLNFSSKYRHEFRQDGMEPPMNRVCRLEVAIHELKLTPPQRTVFDRLMGARVHGGTVRITYAN